MSKSPSRREHRRVMRQGVRAVDRASTPMGKQEIAEMFTMHPAMSAGNR